MARNRRSLPEINAGSMADIAFLLLIFFLVTTTMDQDTGIARKLPPMPEEEQEKPPEIKAKNIYVVLINSKNELLVEGEWTQISQLKEGAKAFINNNGVDPTSSDSPEKAIISLQNDRGTEYVTYIRVQNELAAAYNELRNDAALSKFGEQFNNLNKTQQKEIKKIYPQKISEAEPKNIGGK
ncbi:MAG: biopolymer transporter ExbD [Flavobacteriales bacterium]|nr:biopolymer transporter ExbD [Flavobacteriales bacterium]